MTPLSCLLAIKIAVSVVFLVLPLLLFSKDKLAGLFRAFAPSPILFRLYGVAISALLVAYGSGLTKTLGGTFPHTIVLMGGSPIWALQSLC